MQFVNTAFFTSFTWLAVAWRVLLTVFVV